MSKLAPVAFGAEFILDKGRPISISVTLGWSCYYRVFPTYQQQCEYQRITNTPHIDTKKKQDEEKAVLDIDDDNDISDSSPEVFETVQDRRSSRVQTLALHVAARLYPDGII